MRKLFLFALFAIAITTLAVGQEVAATNPFFYYMKRMKNREQQIKENQITTAQIIQRTCSQLLTDDAIGECKVRGNQFLTKHGLAPCRPELFQYYKYNLMDHLCQELPNPVDDIPGTHRKTPAAEIYSRCLFWGYAFSFPPDPEKYRHRQPELSGETFSQLQVRINDPCQSFSFPTANYEQCFRKQLNIWIVGSFNRLRGTENSILRGSATPETGQENDPYRHCGGKDEIARDVTWAALSDKQYKPKERQDAAPDTDKYPQAIDADTKR